MKKAALRNWFRRHVFWIAGNFRGLIPKVGHVSGSAGRSWVLWRSHRATLFFAFLAMGCGTGGVMGEQIIVPQVAVALEGASREAPPLTADTFLRFSPSPDTKELTVAALQRLSDATGLVFEFDKRGTPISFASETLVNEDGEPVCGKTLSSFDKKTGIIFSHEILLSPEMAGLGCYTVEGEPASVLAHEVIHALNDRVLEHSTDGVFAERASDDRLTAATLVAACTTETCAFMKAEE